MTRIELAGWILECDPGATARALAALPGGAPEACACAGCRNFVAAREEAYGPEFRALLASLGAPPDREAEVYECGPAERRGWRRYGGWFHVVGRVVRDPLVDAAPVGRPFVALAPGFEVCFASGGSLVPSVLEGQPVVQVEFEAEVPWVLAEPAPEP